MTDQLPRSVRRLVGTLRNPRTGAVRGPVWVAASAAVTGAATYAALIVVARVLGAAGYADFAVFWSFVVITSFGVFLPLEQEVASRVARAPGDLPAMVRPAVTVAGLYAVVMTVVGIVAWHRLGSADRPGGTLVDVALVVLCLAFAAQFSGRGLLSGRLELAGYAATVTADALFRLAALVVVAILVASVGGFALAVAVSAGVAAAVAWRRVRRLARQAMPAPSGERLSATSILGGSARLVVGALGMQLLVNSGPLIARAESSVETMEFAGHLLAAMTLARVPVFILQSLQATYLARIAGAAHDHDAVRLRKTLAALAGLVGLVGGLTVFVAAAAGPFLLRVIYGPSFDISRDAAVLVAVGVALYVVATVANDTNIALGHHPRVALSWLAAVVVGALSLTLTSSLLVRSTLPLIAGSVVAGAALLLGVARSLREISH